MTWFIERTTIRSNLQKTVVDFDEYEHMCVDGCQVTIILYIVFIHA
jgi:hypothetical protein